MKNRKLLIRSLLLWLWVVASTLGCLEVRDTDASTDSGEGCGQCHLELGTTPAHAVHVSDQGLFGRGFECTECHVVPDDWFVPAHLDGLVQVVFSRDSLARTGGLEPSWDGARCTNVYCHGATLGGGTNVSPRWRDESTPGGLQCNNCHGIPPLQPHPTTDVGKCSHCHEAAYTAEIKLDKSKHINGYVDFLAPPDSEIDTGTEN